MKLRKFVASDMRDAIAQVKRALGADAMIVATRPVRKGLQQLVEVTAAVDHDEPMAPMTVSMPGPAALETYDEPVVRERTARSSSASTSPATANALAERDIERMMERVSERLLMPLRSELRSLRTMMRPLLDRAGRDGDAELRREMQALRSTLSEMTAAAPAAPAPEPIDFSQVVLAAAPARPTIALVGPTGVGKTTTIAKLAARAALLEQRSVAIVTMDTFRVGGEDQVRQFADLMGVPLHLVTDPAELCDVLDALASHERIFIDTAGRSPRDPGGVGGLGDLALALSNRRDVEVHLAIAAGTSARQIDATVERFASLSPARIVFTKCDEAVDLSELLATPARTGLPVSFLATGQRVPEDLEEAAPERMVALASTGYDGGEEVAA